MYIYIYISSGNECQMGMYDTYLNMFDMYDVRWSKYIYIYIYTCTSLLERGPVEIVDLYMFGSPMAPRGPRFPPTGKIRQESFLPFEDHFPMKKMIPRLRQNSEVVMKFTQTHLIVMYFSLLTIINHQ